MPLVPTFASVMPACASGNGAAGIAAHRIRKDSQDKLVNVSATEQRQDVGFHVYARNGSRLCGRSGLARRCVPRLTTCRRRTACRSPVASFLLGACVTNARLLRPTRVGSFLRSFPLHRPPLCAGNDRRNLLDGPAVTRALRAHRRSRAALAGRPCDARVAPLATAIISHTGS